MKPLTIEKLKSLEAGDWVWISQLNNKRAGGYVTDINFTARMFTCKSVNRVSTTARIADYGTKWLTYKNKEQAETKGDIIELPCVRKTKSTLPPYEVVYINEYDRVVVERFTYENEAKFRLAELKGEV